MPSPYYDPGIYLCRVTEQRLSETQKGYPQLVLAFDVSAKRTSADDYQGVDGPPRRWYQAVTDQTIGFVLEDVAALGFRGMSFNHWDQESQHCYSLIGTEITMRCEHKAHYKTGEPHEEWTVFRQREIPKASKTAISQLAAFDAQLKAMNRGEAVAEQPIHKPAPPAAAVQPAPSESDDIPF